MTVQPSDLATSTSIIAARLGRAEIFKDLADVDLLAIAEFCKEDVCRENEFLLVESEPADLMFVVERGKVALEKKVLIGRHSTPRTATIGYVGPGQVAGFSTLTDPHVYSTSAVCVEPTRVIVMDGVALRAYLEENPAAGHQVMNSIASLVARPVSVSPVNAFFLSASCSANQASKGSQTYLRTTVSE